MQHAQRTGGEVVPVLRPRRSHVAAIALATCFAGSGITAHKADAAAHPKDFEPLYELYSPTQESVTPTARSRVRLRLVEPTPDQPPTTITVDADLVATLLAARHDPDLFEDVAYELATQVIRQLG